MAPEHRAALATVERLCADVTDGLALRVAVLAALRQTLHFDAFVWALTDPVTTVGAAPYAQVPAVEELPELIRGKYLSTVNRWTDLPGGVALLSDREPAEAPQWRAFLQRHAVSDVASVVHADHYGCWAFMDLWRIGGTFSSRDTALLTDTRMMLTAALRARQAATLSALPAAGTLTPGPVVLLLDDDLRVVGDTEAADRWLARLLPPEPGRRPVPAVVFNTAAQLLASEAGVDLHSAWARVHLGGGQWATARAARLQGEPGPGRIAVSIEQTSPADRLEIYARANALSPRESELISLLAQGVDTREAAQQLFLSPNTVQDHLKSVFDKTGTRSRRVLLSRALGTAPANPTDRQPSG